MHQSIPNVPMPLRGKPQALAFFFFLDGKFLGEECLKSQLPCSGNKNRRASTPPIGCPLGHLGCVPFSESKNGFLILDLPDFAVERNVKSEIGFVTLVTFRQRVQYARQPLKKRRFFYCLTNYVIKPCRI